MLVFWAEKHLLYDCYCERSIQVDRFVDDDMEDMSEMLKLRTEFVWTYFDFLLCSYIWYISIST